MYLSYADFISIRYIPKISLAGSYCSSILISFYSKDKEMNMDRWRYFTHWSLPNLPQQRRLSQANDKSDIQSRYLLLPSRMHIGKIWIWSREARTWAMHSNRVHRHPKCIFQHCTKCPPLFLASWGLPHCFL